MFRRTKSPTSNRLIHREASKCHQHVLDTSSEAKEQHKSRGCKIKFVLLPLIGFSALCEVGEVFKWAESDLYYFPSWQGEAEAMKLMNQQDVYESVGRKIKSDLYEGNAVVLFAYGLSGSGKTFTVFGPDAVDIPEVRAEGLSHTFQLFI